MTSHNTFLVWVFAAFVLLAQANGDYLLRTNSACYGNGGYIPGYQKSESSTSESCRAHCDSYGWCKGYRWNPVQCRLLHPTNTISGMDGWTHYGAGSWVEPDNWSESSANTYECYERTIATSDDYLLRTNSACYGDGGYIPAYQRSESSTSASCRAHCDSYSWCRGYRWSPTQCHLLHPTGTISGMDGWGYSHEGHWVEPINWSESSEVAYECYERTRYPINHILFASDSRWSDIDDEDVELQEGFEANGFIVSKMSGFTTGSLNSRLSGYSQFVYPEAEVSSMSTYFNDNDYDALLSWIDLGGYWTSFMHADSLTMMNKMLGWSIHYRSSACGNERKISDILKGGPESLKVLSAVHSVKTSSLPSEATCVYGAGDCCSVFVANVGAGRISWLGYDWHPNADSSAVEDWNDVAALTLMSGYADVKACHWISIDLNSKDIKGADFFGYECPSKEFISEIKVQRYKSNSHLHNNPVEVKCCEISGTHHVTETCVDHFTQDTGTAEDALCEGNSVLSGIYNIVNQMVDLNELEYDQTMAHRCCEISACEAEYCNEGNGLSIDKSSCITIGHESDPESDGELSTLSCPAETVLKKIIDVDVAIGVQEVYEIECCDLVQVAPPSLYPSFSPSHSPSVSPTTTCMSCLMTLHKENIANDQLAMSRYQECLDNHCCA